MPLFWISLAFLCGIALSAKLNVPILSWSAPAFLALMFLILPITRRFLAQSSTRLSRISASLRLTSPTIIPLMIVFLSLGAIDYRLAQPKIDAGFIAYYNEQSPEYIIEAVITEPPDVRDTYTYLQVESQQLHSCK